MPKERMRWAELLDVLTDSDRSREIVVERATETERLALFLLRREGWSAQAAPKIQKHYDIELVKPERKSPRRFATSGRKFISDKSKNFSIFCLIRTRKIFRKAF